MTERARSSEQSAVRAFVLPVPDGQPANSDSLSGFASGALYADGISNCFVITIEPFFVESSRICFTGT